MAKHHADPRDARFGAVGVVFAVAALGACDRAGEWFEDLGPSPAVNEGPEASASLGLSDDENLQKALVKCMTYGSEDYCRKNIYGD